MPILSISVTLVIFTYREHHLSVGMLSSPTATNVTLLTGDIDPAHDDNLELAAHRIFTNAMHVTTPYLEQVGTIGQRGRGGKTWPIAINYYCLISPEKSLFNENIIWFNLSQLTEENITQDDREIIQSCLQRFQNKSLYTSLPIFLLPKEFTLTEVQHTYEAILGLKMEKKSFRRRLLDADFLQETGNTRRASHRPAQLYCLAHEHPYYFSRIIEGVRDTR